MTRGEKLCNEGSIGCSYRQLREINRVNELTERFTSSPNRQISAYREQSERDKEAVYFVPFCFAKKHL